MNLQKIYESLKREYESKGIEIEDYKLRQLAWNKRDRILFESSISYSNSVSSSSAGGSGNRRSNFIATESGKILTTENGSRLSI